jgi:antirestriction protein ArdC
MNIFILGAQGRSPYWATYKQVDAAGGKVRKGEHGTPIFFWNFSRKKVTKGDKEVEKAIPFLRYYTVFNADQCDLPEALREKLKVNKPETSAIEKIARAEEVAHGYKGAPRVNWVGGDQACYSPSSDTVTMPDHSQFELSAERYCTLFHELGHSTGHKTRLDRPGITSPTGFGSREYAREELIAEMTAAYLCGECGIEGTFNNSASYIKSWLGALRDDQYLFIHAAGKAQVAADYILGRTTEEEED